MNNNQLKKILSIYLCRMIYKNTWVIPSNKLDIIYIKVIHLYNKVNRYCSKIGYFIRILAKRFFFKMVWRKKLKKGGFILFTKFKIFFKDLSYFLFYYNSILIVKKRLTPLGTFVFGPTFFFLRRKKLQLSFTHLL